MNWKQLTQVRMFSLRALSLSLGTGIPPMLLLYPQANTLVAIRCGLRQFRCQPGLLFSIST